MKFNITNSVDKNYDIVVIPCFSDEKVQKYSHILDKLRDKKIFSCKSCTSYSFVKDEEDEILNRVFLGLGKKKDLNYENMYKSIVSCFKNFKFDKPLNILVNLFESENLSSRDLIKAFVLAISGCGYSFSKYFTKRKEECCVNVEFYGENIILSEEHLKESLNIRDAINLTRNLVNEPSNILTPEEFSKRCLEAIENLNVDISVYDEKWIKENGLKALYEVGKASSSKPRFIVMKYFGDDTTNKSISFVGKGLTYDSGGYSIKSSDGMVTMKCDMAGAASVLSLMTLISKQNLKINVYGIIPTCENMVSGDGFKPGDVIGSLSGKTIEVISTDAEGRLVLADGVYYAANKLNTDIIIDIATLTGACGIALGTKYAAIIDNNEELFKKLNDSSKNTVDSIWRLPADEEYKELLKSDIADLKNLGGRYGGTITAGLFIGEFIENKPWAHIDIAYVSWNDFPSKIFPKKGSTGAGIEFLYEFCKNNEKKIKGAN